MNYLAHLYLSHPHPDYLVGSIMGDFVKGEPPVTLNPRLRQGVLLHRRVDSYTDAHEAVLTSKRRLQPPFRRFGGIIVDMAYDHCLARHWSRYSDEPLAAFSDRVYGILSRRYCRFPSPMRRTVRYMIAQDWLVSYRDMGGIGRALRGIGTRLSRANPLHRALPELERVYPGLEEDFLRFFPDLIGYVANFEGSRGGPAGGVLSDAVRDEPQ